MKIENGRLKIGAVIVCGGSGKRAGFEKNKLLIDIGGGTAFEKTLRAFVSHEKISRIVIVCKESETADFKALCKNANNLVFTNAGETRAESVKNGLLALKSCDIAVIHDGARPFVTKAVIDASIVSAAEYGSGICAVPVSDTVASVNNGFAENFPERSVFYNIQTPQTFNYKEIFSAYQKVRDFSAYTDDASIYKAFIKSPKICAGDRANVKLTYPEDFAKAFPCRYGIGMDIHRFAQGRDLILGGVKIPYNLGLLGHSDADALIHAIMDALLSACGLRDIGYYFPDTDKQYKNISSLLLLEKVFNMIKKDFAVINVSGAIGAETPKMNPHIPKMCKNIAGVLNVRENEVSISATTFEGLGLVGRREGIYCQAIVSVSQITNYKLQITNIGEKNG